jgi:hypothetical protein
MQDGEAVVVVVVLVVVVQTYAAFVVVFVVVVVDMVAEGTMPGGHEGYRKWRSPATPPERNARVPEIRTPHTPIFIFIYIYIHEYIERGTC